jgi:hypothetical protein
MLADESRNAPIRDRSGGVVLMFLIPIELA